MEIAKFKESNVEFAKFQPGYLTMPAHRSDDNTITSCWRLTFSERVRILFTRRVWVQLSTRGTPQPQFLRVDKPDFE